MIRLHWRAQQIPDAKHFGTALNMSLATYVRSQTRGIIMMIGCYVRLIQVTLAHDFLIN